MRARHSSTRDATPPSIARGRHVGGRSPGTPRAKAAGASTFRAAQVDQLPLFVGDDSTVGDTATQADRPLAKSERSTIASVGDEYGSLPIRLIDGRSGCRASGARPALVHSIARVGLLQPLLVEPRGGRYRLVAGRARLAAVRALEWEKVPCHILPPLDALFTALVPLTENVVRQQLMGDDRAKMYRALSEVMGSQTQAALAVGVHRVSYSRSMRDVRRTAEDLREASLPRKAVAVLDRLQLVASTLNPTQRSVLASQLRRLLSVLGTQAHSGQEE